jgi:predicted nuclease of predicted toxin-antitoxin system
MKLLLDMNLTPRWVPYLEAAGFETLHWSKVGRASAPDEEIMAYAARLGMVVLTHDLDFSAILAATKGKKPSVVQVRAQTFRPNPSELKLSRRFGIPVTNLRPALF